MCFEIGTFCVKVHVSIDSYVLNSKSAAFQSIWLKFGQSDAISVSSTKPCLRILILLFILRIELFFPQGVVINCLPQLHLLIKEKQTHLSKILDTAFWWNVLRSECGANYFLPFMYFYTKRSNFETHLSKSFLLVQIHNLE